MQNITAGIEMRFWKFWEYFGKGPILTQPYSDEAGPLCSYAVGKKQQFSENIVLAGMGGIVCKAIHFWLDIVTKKLSIVKEAEKNALIRDSVVRTIVSDADPGSPLVRDFRKKNFSKNSWIHAGFGQFWAEGLFDLSVVHIFLGTNQKTTFRCCKRSANKGAYQRRGRVAIIVAVEWWRNHVMQKGGGFGALDDHSDNDKDDNKDGSVTQIRRSAFSRAA